ncbi:MAG: hypothetical protein AB7P35_17680 [Hyphomonadaceae bacterium]
MRFVKFEPGHLFAFEAQDAQKPYLQWTSPDIAKTCAAHFSFTGIDDRGRIVGCAGLAPWQDGALAAWAVFSPSIHTHARAVLRAVRSGLDLHRTRTIVAYVAPEHVKAARFAEALDFSLSGRDELPNGQSVLRYAREAKWTPERSLS